MNVRLRPLYSRRPGCVGAATLLSVAICFPGCEKASPPDSSEPVHAHVHHPPHGGTPIVLGEEAYHIELVRDAAEGKLDAYILDGEMEQFVRIAQPAIECVVGTGPDRHTIIFRAVADQATGETVGDTSFFEVTGDWVKVTNQFDGVIKSIQVKGNSFSAVSFNFPKGNDRD
jgi:hypothetical protein